MPVKSIQSIYTMHNRILTIIGSCNKLKDAKVLAVIAFVLLY